MENIERARNLGRVLGRAARVAVPGSALALLLSRLSTMAGRSSRRLLLNNGQKAEVPYSLYFDGINDLVDCGDDPSVMDLHVGDFTFDVYFELPAAGDLGATAYPPISQLTYSDGWFTYYYSSRIYVGANDGWQVSFSQPAGDTPQWHYIRGRKSSGAFYASLDGGAESADLSGGPVDPATNPLMIGQAGPFWFKGRVCYAHVWNSDQGVLSAMPTSPLPVNANTVARYTFSEGAGLALADDSGNGNNGTITGATWGATVPAGWSIG